jgi:hypothetical protein
MTGDPLPRQQLAGRRPVIRVLAGGFAVWGLAQLAFPERLVHAVAPGRPQPPRWLVRLLGGRMAAQYAVLAVAPTRPAGALSATVDGLHAASMLVVAMSRPSYRRVGLVSAGVAAAGSMTGVLSTRLAER